jgi:cytochrome c-type biogenesis protein CcmF
LNTLLGNTFVLGALACAAFGGVLGIESGLRRREQALVMVRWSVYGFFACMLLANLTMVRALVTHDFSVAYVSHVGSRATPLLYTIVSLWSALEGSILFWGAILGVYLLAFTLSLRDTHERYMALSLGVMLLCGTFFAFLIAGPANPFHAVSPVPPDGPGPNALLQNDVLMIIHPPMLYSGYVGMVIPFGMAMAALLRGELGDAWLAPLRRWTLIPWAFLSVGIVLGSWWAYRVLGWGGYWAWDPVENASFLPWLTATAFLHSLMVMERRAVLKLWTVALALGSFALTILGTFMTRSGVFNSVHSFTQSEIGPTFLVFLGLVLVASIALLGLRGHLLVAAEGAIGSPASREAGMLVNNLLLSAFTFTVLLGTVYPIITEAVRGVRVSVGEPYFNSLCVPQGLAILFLMGVGPLLPWGRPDPAALKRQVLLPAGVGIGVVLVGLAFGLRGALPLATFGLGGFVTAVTLREMFLPAWVRMREKNESAARAVLQAATRARRRFGGYLTHLGIVSVFMAVAATKSYSHHTEGTLSVGQSFSVGGYQVTLLGLASGREPHREWRSARLSVTDGSGRSEVLEPRMNFYAQSTEPVGSPAVRSHVFEDVYLSLRAFTPNPETATLSTWTFPLVGFIWLAIPFFVLGAAIAAWPGKKRPLATHAGASASLAQATVPPDVGRGVA